MAPISTEHRSATEISTPPSGNLEAKKFLILVLGYIPLLGAGLIFPSLMISLAWCIPLVLCVALILAIKLLYLGESPLPPTLATVGITYIFGGVLFDMTATVLHSPSLNLEGNSIARAFLDSGYAISFVYGYAILSQGVFVAVLSVLWLAFLKHRHQIVKSIGCPATVGELISEAIGQRYRVRRKWWDLRIDKSELPLPYHLVWLLTVLLVVSASDSWYLGLEWFRVLTSIRWIVAGITFTSGILCYFAWLWFASRNSDGTK